MPQSNNSYKPFRTVLRDLLIEREITTGMGNPNWSAFAELMHDVGYETLRKAVTGDREPTPHLMEESAKALNLDPAQTFVEYALWQARREFDPREVGTEAALSNLESWLQARKRRR